MRLESRFGEARPWETALLVYGQKVDQPSRRSDILNDVQIDWARALYASGFRSLSESGETRQGRREGIGVRNPVNAFLAIHAFHRDWM